jgi:hypothetical protein
MERKYKDERRVDTKNLVKKLKIAGAITLGVFAAEHGFVGEQKTKTDTYQGYLTQDHQKYLVFDENSKAYRVNSADLTIPGNPEGLEIGKKYTVDYTHYNWLPDKINSIKAK